MTERSKNAEALKLHSVILLWPQCLCGLVTLTNNTFWLPFFVKCAKYAYILEIDTSLAQFQKLYFWRPFWIFFENAVGHIGGSRRPILLIFNSKHRKTTLYLAFDFEENRNKIVTVRVQHWKSTKWPPWRQPFWIFKNREKRHLQISSRSFVESLIKIDPSVLAVEMTRTHTQTHRHPHPEV